MKLLQCLLPDRYVLRLFGKLSKSRHWNSLPEHKYPKQDWVRQYRWLNDPYRVKNFTNDRAFKGNKETTIIINSSSSKFRIEFSKTPLHQWRENNKTDSSNSSLLILSSNETIIYNIFSQSSTLVSLLHRRRFSKKFYPLNDFSVRRSSYHLKAQ